MKVKTATASGSEFEERTDCFSYRRLSHKDNTSPLRVSGRKITPPKWTKNMVLGYGAVEVNMTFNRDCRYQLF